MSLLSSGAQDRFDVGGGATAIVRKRTVRRSTVPLVSPSPHRLTANILRAHPSTSRVETAAPYVHTL
jgi:hypothetical protein